MTSQPARSMQTQANPTIVIWCLSDGRPGHRRQIEGLVAQLTHRRPLDVHWIDVSSGPDRQGVSNLLRGRFDAGADLPDPDMILAAGHSTHLPSLAARRARGGLAVVLMRPTLPTGLFDLCLVPDHDLVSLLGRLNRMRVVPTRGVLNPFVPSTSSDPTQALMLIGGPSRHHGWCNDSVLHQLREIWRLSPTNVDWTLTTSRRTPTTLLSLLETERLRDTDSARVRVVPFEATGPGWLAGRMSQSKTVFVTEDSISMVYEALTVGADVGLLQVPRLRRSRNSICIDRLLADGLVVSFKDWCSDRFEYRRQDVFNEASRCADIVCQRLLKAA